MDARIAVAATISVIPKKVSGDRLG